MNMPFQYPRSNFSVLEFDNHLGELGINRTGWCIIVNPRLKSSKASRKDTNRTSFFHRSVVGWLSVRAVQFEVVRGYITIPYSSPAKRNLLNRPWLNIIFGIYEYPDWYVGFCSKINTCAMLFACTDLVQCHMYKNLYSGSDIQKNYSEFEYLDMQPWVWIPP